MTCSPYVEHFEAFEQCTLKKKYDFIFYHFFNKLLWQATQFKKSQKPSQFSIFNILASS